MKEIKFKNLDWYVLEETNETAKLLLKDVLDEERTKKYSDDDFMINGCEVRHQDNIRDFDWNKSYIKNTILPNFEKDLGIECEADLLTKEEVEELPDEVRQCNDWYWTKSRSNSNRAWVVRDSGGVDDYSMTGSFAVRPVLYLSSNLITSEDTGQMTCSEELDNNIEKLDYTYKNMYGNISQHRQSEKELIDKINEIIDVINKLKKGK